MRRSILRQGLHSRILLAALSTAFLCSSCTSNAPVTANIGYTPPFLPVTLTVDTNGNIALHGNLSIVTPAGTFSIGANVSHTMKPVSGGTLLIIRHWDDGKLSDTVYTVHHQQIVVVTNGKTIIAVTNGRVFIDVSKGRVMRISVQAPKAARTRPQHFVVVGQTIRDPLTSSDHSQGWPTRYYPPGGEYCGFEQDGFYVGPNPGNDVKCANTQITISNAEVTVTATLRSDNVNLRNQDFPGGSSTETGYGLGIRGAAESPYVGFQILPDGHWMDGHDFSSVWHPFNPAIHRGLGHPNVLEIKATGERLRYFVNGVHIGGQSITNAFGGSAWSPGGIQFLVDGYDSAIFSNLVIRRLR
jgi:hypothetical protein